jgi:hypothetical protein
VKTNPEARKVLAKLYTESREDYHMVARELMLGLLDDADRCAKLERHRDVLASELSDTSAELARLRESVDALVGAEPGDDWNLRWRQLMVAMEGGD